MRATTSRIAVTVAALAGSFAWPAAAPAEPTPTRPSPPVQIAPPAELPRAPSFELVDRGESVEVIARNIKAARTAILAMRSRLEIPIVAGPTAKRLIPGDATVKLIELDSEDSVRVLSVKLGFERADVKALARFAQAIQVGDDLHVLVPRKVPADGAASRLPDPTLSPALAAAVARADLAPELQLGPPPAPAAPTARLEPASPAKHDSAPVVVPAVDPSPVATTGPTLGPAPRPIDPTGGSAPRPAGRAVGGPTPRDLASPIVRPVTAPATALPTASDAARDAAAKPTGDTRPLTRELASDPDERWSKISMYGAVGLAAAGAGIWLMRRRRGLLSPASTIEVIAQRSLGGKARIVWLSAGPREMLVAVTGQQVCMLSQWRKPEAPPARSQELVHEPSLELPGRLPRELPREFSRELPRELGPKDAAALPAPHVHADTRLGDGDEPADKPLSPAISGILRLRGRTGQFSIPQPQPQLQIDEAVASCDVEADAAWAREILAATGATGATGARR
jgi:hypothetical protein